MAEARETENPPVYPQTDATHVGIGRGITLRDYFAAAALTGLIANDVGEHAACAWAYCMSNKMLSERQKGGR